MSTQYVCYENKDEGTSVELDEHSSRFDLTADDDLGQIIIRDLSPEEVTRMATKMLLAASYNMDADEMQEIINSDSHGYRIGITL